MRRLTATQRGARSRRPTRAPRWVAVKRLTTMTRTADYEFELPRELIAQFPLARRTDARLLIVNRRERSLTHAHVRDLPELLHAKDAIVLNDTRVIPARLAGYRLRTKGRWQGLFLSASEQVWRVLGKTRGRLQPGETIVLQDRSARDSMRLTMVANLGGGEWAARPDSDDPPLTLLDRVGRVPLPGYIRGGEMTDADPATYQTVFATRPGAVAAPTAGLHFTEELLQAIERAGTAICRVTLHVGLGTFRPIASETLEQHSMHTEWGSIDSATAAQIHERRAAGGRVVAIGTTVVRTLETAVAAGSLGAWQGETNLFIRPPYTFRAVDALLTNFHLPRSTLLVLVRTFGGDELIKHAYEEAIREGYRFYSYGDAMLIV
jgi:S-adenosylmethionine:tRNA ribosyltransferase-isomerase